MNFSNKKDNMNCYVVSQGSKYDQPEACTKENTLYFPETGMTTHDLLNTGRPKQWHIITDSHFLVPMYKREEVFIWNGQKWVNPDFQTYGASYNLTISKIWNSRYTIPRMVVDGKITNVMGHKFKA